MREFLRSDLPEVIAGADRLRQLVSRSSTGYGVLAGIGGGVLVGQVLRALTFALLAAVPIANAPRPYDFEQIAGPAAGLIIARRVGGMRAAYGYLAYSLLVAALGWLSRALTCAFPPPSELGLGSFCSYGPLDLIAGDLPLLVGLALGAVLMLRIADAPYEGVNPLLEAAGAYCLPSVVLSFGARAFVYGPGGLSTPMVVLVIASALLAGVVAGVVVGLRSSAPRRTALVLAALLVATWLYPLGATQFMQAARVSQPEVYLFALPLLDLLTIPLTAWVVARTRVGA